MADDDRLKALLAFKPAMQQLGELMEQLAAAYKLDPVPNVPEGDQAADCQKIKGAIVALFEVLHVDQLVRRVTLGMFDDWMIAEQHDEVLRLLKELGETLDALIDEVGDLIEAESFSPKHRLEIVEDLLAMLAQEGHLDRSWTRVNDLPVGLYRRVKEEIL